MRRHIAVWFLVMLTVTGCSKVSPPQGTGVSVPPVTSGSDTDPAPYHPGEKHRQALALIGSQKFREAEAALQAAVREEPENADAWNDLSLVQAKLGHYDAAAQSAQTALRIRPGFLYAQYNLGWALINTARWRDAMEPLEASRKAQPDRPEPLHALGKWYELSGDKDQALSLYQRAAAMGYQPAQIAAATLANQQLRRAAANAAVAQFPQAPPGVIRGVMEGYIPEGTTRKLVQITPVRFDAEQAPLWAALVFDTSATSVWAQVLVYRATANGQILNGYAGTCGVASPPAGASAQLQSVAFTGGEHLMVKLSGQTVLCGFKGEYVTNLLSTKETVSVSGSRLQVGGQLLGFVPATAAYLPAAKAEALLTLISEVRAAGAAVKTTEAVAAEVTLAGRPALALAWAESGLMIAVRPQGEPTIVHTVSQIAYPTPYRVGQVVVPGHTFLAVATHQVGAPNGGNVLVVEYDQANRRFRELFRGMGDGANFSDKDVSTSFKLYRPEGGFDVYVTPYTWNEAQGKFVGGKAETRPQK